MNNSGQKFQDMNKEEQQVFWETICDKIRTSPSTALTDGEWSSVTQEAKTILNEYKKAAVRNGFEDIFTAMPPKFVCSGAQIYPVGAEIDAATLAELPKY